MNLPRTPALRSVRNKTAIRFRLRSFLHNVRIQQVVRSAKGGKLERAGHGFLRREKHRTSRGSRSSGNVCRGVALQRSPTGQRIEGVRQSKSETGRDQARDTQARSQSLLFL